MKNTQVRQKSAPIKCKNTKGSGKPTSVQCQRYTWVIIKRKLVFLMIGRLLQIICLMWWLMFTSPACPALYFDSYGIEDGLSQSSITSIFQDRYGYMWFGTQEGLSRFDGHDFKTFRRSSGDRYALSGNLVKSIDEDKRGNSWVGTFIGGMNRFDYQTQRFTHFHL
jgi:ligand-binding sensor domain-containing protein